MKIIETTALPNGAHNNSESETFDLIPDGWAVIPETVHIPSTYPFVYVKMVNGEVAALTPNQEAFDLAMEGLRPSTETIMSNSELTDILNILLD